MVELILILAGPAIVAPLIVLAFRHLYAVFLKEGAMLFVGLAMHRQWALTIATRAAIANASIFAAAWWLSVGLKALDLPALLVVAPFLAALAGGLACTSLYLRGRLALDPLDAWLVGLLTFTGGNLPVLIAFPAILALVR